MKIAILMSGHLRSWESCKNSFLQNVYDTNHEIDVFLETYNNKSRTDTTTHNENEKIKELSFIEIANQFHDINVVNLSIENNFYGTAEIFQIRKMENQYEKYKTHNTISEKHYEMMKSFRGDEDFSKNTKYDLVMRTRPDLFYHTKLDYNYILSECNKNNKLIFIPNTMYLNVGQYMNDIFAIGSTESMHIYFEERIVKFNIFNNAVHSSMINIKDNFNISYNDGYVQTQIIR